MKHSLAFIAWVLAWIAPLGAAALAQSWPTRPVTIVVPFPPGPLDVVSRLVGAKMSESLGQPMIIDNRAGANGTIGSSLVARAVPDGYTILSATIGTHVTSVHLIKNLPYNPVRDFTPIALFNQTAGVKIQHVPYRGVGPAMQDVVGGHIPIVFTSVSTALPNLKDGRIKILAVLEPTRYSRMPDVASITEVLPAFRKPSGWFGYFGPSGMPPEIVARLNREIVKGLNAPAVLPKLEELGYAVIGGPPEQFAALIPDGIERFGAIIKAAGIQPE